jgi:hypothetical protein
MLTLKSVLLICNQAVQIAWPSTAILNVVKELIFAGSHADGDGRRMNLQPNQANLALSLSLSLY